MTRQFKVKYVAIITYPFGVKKESDMFSDYLLCVAAAKREMTKEHMKELTPLYFTIEKRYIYE